jgi:hypothetical protein
MIEEDIPSEYLKNIIILKSQKAFLPYFNLIKFYQHNTLIYNIDIERR